VTATDDALLVLRSAMPSTITRTQARHLARETERLRAFEQAIRGAALHDSLLPARALVARFDEHYRDPADRAPAASREQQ
jgi:hypothetical protein